MKNFKFALMLLASVVALAGSEARAGSCGQEYASTSLVSGSIKPKDVVRAEKTQENSKGTSTSQSAGHFKPAVVKPDPQ